MKECVRAIVAREEHEANEGRMLLIRQQILALQNDDQLNKLRAQKIDIERQIELKIEAAVTAVKTNLIIIQE